MVREGEVRQEVVLEGEGVAEDVDLEQVELGVDGVLEQRLETVHALRTDAPELVMLLRSSKLPHERESGRTRWTSSSSIPCSPSWMSFWRLCSTWAVAVYMVRLARSMPPLANVSGAKRKCSASASDLRRLTRAGSVGKACGPAEGARGATEGRGAMAGAALEGAEGGGEVRTSRSTSRSPRRRRASSPPC